MRLQRITNATDGTFHQAYSYKDALGNFNGIFRNDLVKTNGNWALQNIDDNAYFYGNPLSSKISSILDYTGSQLGYKANSGTYAYDANGNNTYDPANKLTTLYNYLNLPSKFTKVDGSKQELVYDFSGKKWQVKEFNNTGSLLSTHSYLGSFEFEGNSLQRIFHPTGFIQNLSANVNSGGQTNGNITGSNIISTQKLKSGVKSEYIADKSICLLPGFESLPNFNAEIKPLAGFQWNYILRDHLGNTRVLFADKNGDGLIRQDASEALNEVLSLSNYSPFGLELGGSHQNLKQQFDYKFNGKQDNGFSGLTDFGARYLDKPLSVWNQSDPLAEKYVNMSNRNFVNNNPIAAIDPDGKRIYYVAGAGNDQDGWNYVNRTSAAFSSAGINGFTRINSSGWNLGPLPMADMLFSANHRSSHITETMRINMNNYVGGLAPALSTSQNIVGETNQYVRNAVNQITADLQKKPLKSGEQFNLAGYSYGSVVQAHAALELAKTQKIDNLILIGSPISSNSQLFKELQQNKNILNIIRFDIKGDMLSNPKDKLEFLQGIWQNSPAGKGDNAPHFNLARPGKSTDDLIKKMVADLINQGVR